MAGASDNSLRVAAGRRRRGLVHLVIGNLAVTGHVGRDIEIAEAFGSVGNTCRSAEEVLIGGHRRRREAPLRIQELLRSRDDGGTVVLHLGGQDAEHVGTEDTADVTGEFHLVAGQLADAERIRAVDLLDGIFHAVDFDLQVAAGDDARNLRISEGILGKRRDHIIEDYRIRIGIGAGGQDLDIFGNQNGGKAVFAPLLALERDLVPDFHIAGRLDVDHLVTVGDHKARGSHGRDRRFVEDEGLAVLERRDLGYRLVFGKTVGVALLADQDDQPAGKRVAGDEYGVLAGLEQAAAVHVFRRRDGHGDNAVTRRRIDGDPFRSLGMPRPVGIDRHELRLRVPGGELHLRHVAEHRLRHLRTFFLGDAGGHDGSCDEKERKGIEQVDQSFHIYCQLGFCLRFVLSCRSFSGSG